MFADDILKSASGVIQLLQQQSLRLATAESCTGGLLAGAITEISGASEIFECGFITYSNTAKLKLLSVNPDLLAKYGAVSSEVAVAMANGALSCSDAHIALATTGIAGPTGATSSKPVGLVHLAVARKGTQTVSEAHQFGNIGRREVREATVRRGLSLIIECLRAER